MAGFTPLPAGTYLLTAGVASSSVTIPAKPNTVRIFNSGTVVAHIEIGGAAATIPAGSPGSMPIAAGATILVEKGDSTVIAAIVASTTANLFITLGHGDALS